MADSFPAQDNQQDQAFEQQINRALDSYLPQPRAGLEQRILARTQTIAPRPAWLRPRFAILAASAVAACAVAAILLGTPRSVSTPHNARNAVAAKAPQSQPNKTAPARSAPAHLAALTPKPAATRKSHSAPHEPSESNLPHLAVFPAPEPPTPQEQELATFAAHYPKLLQQAFRPMPEPKPEPITIRPVQIKPITIQPLSIKQLNHQQNPILHHPENAQ